jgi:GNAT superfamily N-acetyltransferase
MEIAKAENEIDWARASKLLIRVAERLNNLGRALWSEDQVSVVGLQRSYRLNELHFLLRKSCVGVVFLQEADPYFWPEVTERDSLYVHKLAIDPPLAGNGLGQLAMEAVMKEADSRGFSWVRLDCDDRPELHRFYQGCGFELVDMKEIEVYQVARYQLLTNTGKRRQEAARLL